MFYKKIKSLLVSCGQHQYASSTSYGQTPLVSCGQHQDASSTSYGQTPLMSYGQDV